MSQQIDRILAEVVAPAAVDTDQTGTFPHKAVAALAEAGLLALTVPREHGGGGHGLDAAADLVRRLGEVCGSTAMVVMMHYSATAALVAAARADILTEIAAGRHLSTLAFSEVGSRSHLWAPLGTAVADGDEVVLDARKSWVTSAGEADSYVWSSRPMAAGAGPMSLWLVRRGAPGLSVVGDFDGLGLRGNGSCPMVGERVRVPRSALLGTDGGGLDLAMATVLPCFLLLNAAASVGLMEAVTREAVAHVARVRLEHLDQSLAQQPLPRAAVARMRIETDRTRALLEAALAAVTAGAPDAPLRVLEVKAAADESAAEVTDLAMKTCGGAAFRKELGIERRFRDSRAARVMAPTTDTLLDFVGRTLCGLPLVDGAAGD